MDFGAKNAFQGRPVLIPSQAAPEDTVGLGTQGTKMRQPRKHSLRGIHGAYGVQQVEPLDTYCNLHWSISTETIKVRDSPRVCSKRAGVFDHFGW